MSKHIRTPTSRWAWPLLAVLVTGVTACDESTVAPPMEEEEEEILPGAVTVTTETSGFAKDDGYQLLVNGESAGDIGADDEVTVSDLDPATYEIALGDVADNCAVDAVSVDVASEATATATLSVSCGPGDGDSFTLQATRQRLDLEGGVVIECAFGICSQGDEWDVYFHYNSQTDPHAQIRQNQNDGVEIAHLPGFTLGTLTEEAVAGATFTTELVADPFDAERVILIRTDDGNVYALGNPVEDVSSTPQTLTFDAVQLSAATGS